MFRIEKSKKKYQAILINSREKQTLITFFNTIYKSEKKTVLP